MIHAAEVIYLIKFLLLGIIQGITEPLPISSSGHLVILKDIFGIITPGLSFEIITHLGSLISIIIIYRKDIFSLLTESLRYIFRRENQYKNSFQFTFYILVATFITGIIGLLVEQYISEKLTKPLFAGIALLITGFFIWMIRNLQGEKSDRDLTIKDAMIVGLAQATALIPGISRSGATVVAAMLLGMKRETALRFSFLLFIPVSVGINVLSLSEIIQDEHFIPNIIPYLLAFLASLLATYFALKWFMNVMIKGKLIIFSIYCFIVGTAVIVYQLL
ncbi:undecaprenyl-diphosphate phosphatase [Pseudogracilibacillus sp. SE30717A]|uniref:undecaprenyl-diphosphate phosphatase n=1 Tax=Pseudogracilibacillus sp. SE30717A TaxID=3098293 RepID=UPI00300E5101